MTVREILEAIRALPRPDRLRLAVQLNRELAEPSSEQSVKLGRHMERRGRLLVYTGPLPEPEIDHLTEREERIDELVARVDARRS